MLAGAGVRPRKRFGQHFLIDGNLMRLLVASAELSDEDNVLEVGPGTGGLTDLLVQHARRVICVEIDRDLFAILQERFRNCPNIELICGDALAGKHEINPVVIKALQQERAANLSSRGRTSIEDRSQFTMPRLKLVANLPYDIATPLLFNLLIEVSAMERFCFTVQAEVAQRIMAAPGSKAYGPLGIMAQLLCRVHQTARIGPQSFWPRPQVDSIMLRMDRIVPAAMASERIRPFSRFVHGVFEHRRKTLRSALGFVVDDAARDRICSLVDPHLRPEQVPPDVWLRMSN